MTSLCHPTRRFAPGRPAGSRYCMTSENALLFLTEPDTRRILTWPDAIACLTTAYQFPDNPRAAPPRVVARRDGAWLRALAAISPSGRYIGRESFRRLEARCELPS